MTGSVDFLVSRMVYFMTQQMQGKIVSSFDALRNAISQRPLYVLFEPSLGCDPATDHLHPKNVLPLFSEAVSAAESLALDQPFDEYGAECAEMIRGYFKDLLGDAARTRLAADDFMAQLFSMNKMQQRLFEMIRDLTEGNLIDRARLAEHINFLQQQLHSKQKIVLLYHHDFDNGETERLEKQRLEIENLFKEQIGAQESKQTGAKKQMQEMMKLQGQMVKQLQDSLIQRTEEKTALQQKLDALTEQLGEITALQTRLATAQEIIAAKDEVIKKAELELDNEKAHAQLIAEDHRAKLKETEQHIADLEWKLDFERKKNASANERLGRDAQQRKSHEEALDTIGKLTQKEYETSQLADRLKAQLEGTLDEMVQLRTQVKSFGDEKATLKREIEELKTRLFQQSQNDQNRIRMQLAQKAKPGKPETATIAYSQGLEEVSVQTDVTMVSITGGPALSSENTELQEEVTIAEFKTETEERKKVTAVKSLRKAAALGLRPTIPQAEEPEVGIASAEGVEKEEREMAPKKAKSRPKKQKKPSLHTTRVDILDQKLPSLASSQTLTGTGSIGASSLGVSGLKLSSTGQPLPSRSSQKMLRASETTQRMDDNELSQEGEDTSQEESEAGMESVARPARVKPDLPKGNTREEKLLNLKASREQLEKQLQQIKDQMKQELKTASSMVPQKTLQQIRDAQSPDRVQSFVQTDPSIGQSMSPQRRQLGVLQRQIMREAQRLEQMLKENVYDDEQTQQRVVGADLLDSLVKQQQLTTQFKAQVEILTALDYACIDQAEFNLRKFRGLRDAWVQTALGCGSSEAFVDATEPPDPMDAFKREIQQQQLIAANKTLEARGLRKVALAELYDQQDDVLQKIFARRRREVELFAGAQEKIIQPYCRDRVFEAIQEATAHASQFSAMLIVSTADIKKRYTMLGLQLQRAKSSLAEAKPRGKFLQVGRPMALLK